MPRTLAQNAQYINETIKPAIKSAIEAQGVTVPSTDSFLDYADRIGEIGGSGSRYQLESLPTGTISAVNDAEALPLNALKVSVEAVQSGSGDPSPSNIRPISGWNSGEITVCDDIQNPTKTKTITLNFSQTIYGGEWDVVNGEMNNQYGYLSLNASDYNWTAGYWGNGYRYFTTNSISDAKNNQNCKSSIYPKNPILQSLGITIDTANSPKQVDVRTQDFETLQEWIDFLSQNPVDVIYELATPTTTTQQPLSVRMLDGANNVYADCGEVVEGEYFVEA